MFSRALSPNVRRFLIPFVLFLVAFAVTGWIAVWVFHGEPFCMDEYNYLYQAKIFAGGRLYLSIPEEYEPLAEMYMVALDGKLFSKYAPLWAAVLALGELVNMAALVNPILSGLTVVIVYRTARLFASRAVAFFASLVLATNSYFVGYGASLFAQPLALLLTTAALSCFLHFHREPHRRVFLWAAGGLAAALSLSRIPDALALTMAIAVGILTMPRRPWDVRIMDIAVLCGLAVTGPVVLCAYNYLLTGHAVLAVYNVRRELGVLVVGDGAWETIVASVQAYLKELRASLIGKFTFDFFPVVGWGLVALIVFGFDFLRHPVRRLVAMYVLFLVGIYNLHPGPGWPQYGARYWYPAIGGLALMAAGGLSWIEHCRGRHALATVASLLIAVQVVALSRDLHTYQDRFDDYFTVWADIRHHCPTPAVVQLKEPPKESAWWSPEVSPILKWVDFRRNPYVRGPHYYTYRVDDISDLFPDLPVCVYQFDLFDGRLKRQRPVS